MPHQIAASARANPLTTTYYPRRYVLSIDQRVEVLLGRRARLFGPFYFDQLAGGHVIHVTVDRDHRGISG